MKINTKNFGEIEIDDNKIVEFPQGIMGFEDLKKFAVIYDIEKEDKDTILWLQSLDEAAFAMPVINPLLITDNYNPMVEDELLKCIGDFALEDLLIFTTVTVPSDITKMTSNLKAPIIINSTTRKAIQVIVENEEYKIKHEIYEYLKAKKEGKGE